MSSPLTLFQIPPETRERVRKAIRQLDASGAPLTVRAVSRAAQARVQAAGFLLRLQRQGHLSLDVAWDGTLVPEDLDRRIQAATSDADRAQLCNDLALALHQGLVEPTVARAMGAMLAEARQSDRAARESAEGDDRHQPIYLLSRGAIAVARVYDLIVDPALREQVRTYVLEAGERDVAAFPNPTKAEVEALQTAERERSRGL